MVTGSIFLILALAVIVFMFIFLPLFERSGKDELLGAQDEQEQGIQRFMLLSERERLLNSLLELDADNELGKISSDEYVPLREKLVHETAGILKQLDEINLAASRTAITSQGWSESDEVEDLIAARKRELSRKHGLSANHAEGKDSLQNCEAGSLFVCIHCGQPHMAEDKFCPFCGRKI
jgi:rubrerythrin